jgi:proteasome assembly chaperone 2
VVAQNNGNTPYPPFLPSAGSTRKLLIRLQDKSDVPHAAISAWCVEGDNRGDARALAGLVLGVLGAGEWLFHL